ncbi:MAG: prolyl-tRNA synthetase associated domain-containing protein [Acidobacteria bacterium]|nr:prolyl-tRNA synthetase associated domain-containing protein [Acidobacteriota bacterium]
MAGLKSGGGSEDPPYTGFAPINNAPVDPAPHVYAALDALGIRYERYEHPPVFTAGEAAAHWAPLRATAIKNLFLRNKKGNRHYLVILEVSKAADLRQIVKLVEDDRLSFGSPERLMNELGLTPGSVSPFGLINDDDGSVRVLVDADLRGQERLIFHPNINTASVVISWADLEKFFASRRNRISVVDIA